MRRPIYRFDFCLHASERMRVGRHGQQRRRSAARPVPSELERRIHDNDAAVARGNEQRRELDQRAWRADGDFILIGQHDVMHAALWRDGNVVDLTTLGGPNSAVEWPVENDRGYISGISETSHKDPLGESTSWSCHAFLPDNGSSGDTCVAFVWHDGKMHALPTLGGNNGYGAGMNEGGEIAGWAETKMHDSTCVAPQVLQFLPAVWDAVTRKVRALPTLRGKRKVGSRRCCDRGQSRRRRGWNLGEMLSGRREFHGASCRAVERRQADRATDHRRSLVEHADGDQRRRADRRFSQPPRENRPPGQPGFHFRDRTDPSEKPTKIGTLPGDQLSEPTSINNEGAVLGVSFPSSDVYVWQDGMMTDLTKLVAQSYPQLKLVSIGGINDRGEIAGQACELVSGTCPSSGATFVTFLAVPNDR